jgi:hypothetical protein
MKKILLAVVALGVVVVLALGLYAAYLVRSLATPEFKARVAQEASAVVGAKVELQSLDVSLLRGIRLGGIRIRTHRVGDLLTARRQALPILVAVAAHPGGQLSATRDHPRDDAQDL